MILRETKFVMCTSTAVITEQMVLVTAVLFNCYFSQGVNSSETPSYGLIENGTMEELSRSKDLNKGLIKHSKDEHTEGYHSSDVVKQSIEKTRSKSVNTTGKTSIFYSTKVSNQNKEEYEISVGEYAVVGVLTGIAFVAAVIMSAQCLLCLVKEVRDRGKNLMAPRTNREVTLT